MAVFANRNIADGMGVEVLYGKRGCKNHQVEEHEKEKIVAFTNHRFSHIDCKDMHSVHQKPNYFNEINGNAMIWLIRLITQI